MKAQHPISGRSSSEYSDLVAAECNDVFSPLIQHMGPIFFHHRRPSSSITDVHLPGPDEKSSCYPMEEDTEDPRPQSRWYVLPQHQGSWLGDSSTSRAPLLNSGLVWHQAHRYYGLSLSCLRSAPPCKPTSVYLSPRSSLSRPFNFSGTVAKQYNISSWGSLVGSRGVGCSRKRHTWRKSR